MKRLSMNYKRVIALLLSGAMTLGLAACGSKQETEESKDDEQKEYVYVPEYIEFDNDEGVAWYNMKQVGSNMYYLNNSYDEETMMYTTTVCEYSLESGEVKELPVTFPETRSVNNFMPDSEGNLYTAEYEWIASEDGYDGEEKYYLCKYDAQGNSVMNQDITDVVKQDDEYGYLNAVVLDEDGRFYATADDKVLLFEADGQYQGDITVDGGWVNGIGTGKDGKVYITYFDSLSQNGSYVLAEIDFQGKKIGQTYSNFPGGNGDGSLVKGIEGDFLVNDGTHVYEYSMNTQAATEVLAWLDSDINGTYVNSIGVLEEGKLFVVINDWNTDEKQFAILTKTKASEVSEKIQLTIGTLYENQSLQAVAVAFNKENDKYHVNIKTYIDSNNWTETSWQDGINSLNNDIISGSNCPDILDLSSLNVNQLATKGVFEDLTPYLEKSTILSKDDFLDSVVEAYTMDGKLVCIPKTFSLTTIAGKSSEVGTEMGWTLDEMIAYAEEHPDSMLFDYASKSIMMYYLLSYNQDQFVDWTTGKCSFDSEEFTRILEFIGSFPDEYDWESDERSTPVKIQEGDVLLEMTGIYELNTIQEYDAMFNEPVTFIGYPNQNGDSGCYLSGDQMYAIASKSEHKDGAWAFIEDYLSKEPDDMFSWGFPTNKAQLEKMIDEAVNVEYLKDENGELILDEDGNPIPENGGGGIGYGDWEYTYHTVTQEEVDRVMELIEVAKPVSNSDQQIMTIIEEEAEAFFQGQKSAADVAKVIQSRVQVYVNENR